MRGRPWRRRGCAKSGAAQESKVAALPRGGRAGGPPGLGVWGGHCGTFLCWKTPSTRLHMCVALVHDIFKYV